MTRSGTAITGAALERVVAAYDAAVAVEPAQLSDPHAWATSPVIPGAPGS